MISRQAKAVQQVYADKYKRFQRGRAEQAAAERAAEYQAQQAEAKAEKERIEREQPFNEEVARRLAEHQNQQKGEI